MSRYAAIDLAQYPVADVLETVTFEKHLARDLAEFARRWATRIDADQTLPPIDAIVLESDPSRVVIEVGATREMILRARVNNALRSLTLAGATGRALDHIGATYYRTPRLTGEVDDVYRARLAIAPESWSIAGPDGAYLFHALSASSDIGDVAIYSEDEGVARAPHVRVVILPRAGSAGEMSDGRATPALCATVEAALRRSDLRPLGDLVTVESADVIPFDVVCALTVRPGVSAADVAAQARTRLAGWTAGRTRWVGDQTVGPVWLIGREITEETLAAIARAGDGNIITVDVTVIGGTNTAPAGYRDALAKVGRGDFAVLPPELTAHLFRAPRIRTITVTATPATTGWSP